MKSRIHLKKINNKCRCGEVASAIVKERYNKEMKLVDKYIIRSNCKKCGLDYSIIVDEKEYCLSNNPNPKKVHLKDDEKYTKCNMLLNNREKLGIINLLVMSGNFCKNCFKE